MDLQQLKNDRDNGVIICRETINKLIDYAIKLENKEELIKTAVDKFLSWKLPKDFYPDCGISFMHQTEPIGTNLFTAVQAKEMFEYCLKDK